MIVVIVAVIHIRIPFFLCNLIFTDAFVAAWQYALMNVGPW